MLKEREGNNLLTDNEKKNYLSYNDLTLITHNNLFYKMIHSLLLNLPPRRNRDYMLLKVIYGNKEIESTEFNYYYIDKGLLVYNNYKTVKWYGVCKINLKQKDNGIIRYKTVNKILKKYCLEKGIKNGDFLMGEYKNITPLIKKVFTYKTKSPSLNLLRHSYISYVCGKKYNYNMLSLIASYMGHNIVQQLKYRRLDNNFILHI
jgi:hypothetical protein